MFKLILQGTNQKCIISRGFLLISVVKSVFWLLVSLLIHARFHDPRDDIWIQKGCLCGQKDKPITIKHPLFCLQWIFQSSTNCEDTKSPWLICFNMSETKMLFFQLKVTSWFSSLYKHTHTHTHVRQLGSSSRWLSPSDTPSSVPVPCRFFCDDARSWKTKPRTEVSHTGRGVHQ